MVKIRLGMHLQFSVVNVHRSIFLQVRRQLFQLHQRNSTAVINVSLLVPFHLITFPDSIFPPMKSAVTPTWFIGKLLPEACEGTCKLKRIDSPHSCLGETLSLTSQPLRNWCQIMEVSQFPSDLTRLKIRINHRSNLILSYRLSITLMESVISVISELRIWIA